MARIESLERTAKKVLSVAFDLLEGAMARLSTMGERLASRGDEAPGQRSRQSTTAAPNGGATGDMPQSQPGPEGPLVARIAGEAAVYEAPIPLVEERIEPRTPPREDVGPPPGPPAIALPWAYHDDSFRAMARDPITLWVYWDFSRRTVEEAMAGLEWPTTKLRILQGERRVRDIDFALESGSYYVGGLDPGERYVAEIVFVGTNGERRVGNRSNAVSLPPAGPSQLVDDRFATLSWRGGFTGGIRALEGDGEVGPGVEGLWGEERVRIGASEWLTRRGRPPAAGSGSRYESDRFGRGRGGGA